MTRHRTTYGFGTTVGTTFERTVERVREELAKEGFGVLTEIDVADTMRRKLGKSFRPYVILGACNPPLAHEALTKDLDLGLLLPCNVIVHAADEGAGSVVAIMDPEAMLGLVGNPEITRLATEVSARLHRVLDAVAAGDGVAIDRLSPIVAARP